MDTTDEDVKQLAEEIARYLAERDQVADTLEGIASWWIMRQRLQEARRRVELAMDYLCEKGLVAVRRLPDGAVLYTSAARFQPDADATLSAINNHDSSPS